MRFWDGGGGPLPRPTIGYRSPRVELRVVGILAVELAAQRRRQAVEDGEGHLGVGEVVAQLILRCPAACPDINDNTIHGRLRFTYIHRHFVLGGGEFRGARAGGGDGGGE